MNSDNVQQLAKAQLRTEEGCILKPYKDTMGLLTVGFGWCLDRSPMRLTEAEFRLANDVAQAYADLVGALSWVSNLDDLRASVLVQLCFQLGLHGLLEFHWMLDSIQNHDWKRASDELLSSLYAKQCANRAHRYATMIETGQGVL